MAVIMTLRLTGIEKIPAKQIKPILFAALVDVGYRWRDKWLPLHFKNSATNRYGYTKRKGERAGGRAFKGSYTEAKLDKWKHTRPLVWSGNGRDEALKTTNIKASGSAKTARVKVVLPDVFNLRHPNSKIRMGDEITAVIDGETKDLRKHLVFRLDRRLTEAGKKGKATVKFLPSA